MILFLINTLLAIVRIIIPILIGLFILVGVIIIWGSCMRVLEVVRNPNYPEEAKKIVIISVLKGNAMLMGVFAVIIGTFLVVMSFT